MPSPNARANGGDTDEEVLETDELTRRVLNRSLTVFQQIGELQAAASRAEGYAREARDQARAARESNEETMRAMQSIEKTVARVERTVAMNSVTAARERLDSLISIDEDDPTKVQVLKAALGEQAQEKRELAAKLSKLEDAEKARQTRTAFAWSALKVSGVIVGGIVTLAGATAVIWNVVRFIAAH